MHVRVARVPKEPDILDASYWRGVLQEEVDVGIRAQIEQARRDCVDPGGDGIFHDRGRDAEK